MDQDQRDGFFQCRIQPGGSTASKRTMRPPASVGGFSAAAAATPSTSLTGPPWWSCGAMPRKREDMGRLKQYGRTPEGSVFCATPENQMKQVLRESSRCLAS